MSKKAIDHFIIPIFIPNQGCPYRCIFCNQKSITNSSVSLPSGDSIRKTIDSGINSRRFLDQKIKEVAFFGGTFTSLPPSSMVELLGAVGPYLQKGIIQSIRLSTRPDALDQDKLDILEAFGVTTVELGAQSMDESVLQRSHRGHSASDTINAVTVLKKRELCVGIQLMTGLPGDSPELFMDTIDKVIALQPDMARLYPTLVIRATELAQWYRQGKFMPMGLEETVALCKDACLKLENAGIPVIRIGLMSSPSLLTKGEIIAGPWHPSLGSLVRSAMHLERIRPYLPARGEVKSIVLHVPKEEICLLKGHKNSGVRHLEAITGAVIKDIIPDDSVASGEVAFESA